jgi:hypothetical protein
MALLNRVRAGVVSDDVAKWFRTAFGVEHNKKYGTISVSSHGGNKEYGYNYGVTIDHLDRFNRVKGMNSRAAIDFTQVVQESLPYLSIKPVPVEKYVKTVQSALQLLPND